MRWIARLALCAALFASSGCLWGLRGGALFYTSSEFDEPSGELSSDTGADPDITIDAASDLGVESLTLWQGRLEVLRRRKKLGFGLGFGTTEFSSSSVAPEDLTFGDVTVESGNDLRADVTLDECRLELIKHFRFKENKTRLGLHAGLVWAEWVAKLTDVTDAGDPAAVGPAADISEQSALVPVLGVRYRQKLGLFASFNARVESGSLGASSLFEYSVALGVNPWVSAAFEVGYTGRAVDLERDGERLSYEGAGLSFAAVWAFNF